MKRLALSAAVFLAVALTAAAPALADPNGMVVMKNFDFAPMTVTITHGASVTWKNLDGEPHTVTSLDGTFRSAALDQGDTFSFKFDKPGTYSYTCSIHPRMRASVIVK